MALEILPSYLSSHSSIISKLFNLRNVCFLAGTYSKDSSYSTFISLLNIAHLLLAQTFNHGHIPINGRMINIRIYHYLQACKQTPTWLSKKMPLSVHIIAIVLLFSSLCSSTSFWFWFNKGRNDSCLDTKYPWLQIDAWPRSWNKRELWWDSFSPS